MIAQIEDPKQNLFKLDQSCDYLRLAQYGSRAIRTVLNSILKKMPELLEEAFGVIYKLGTDLIDFDIKRKFFTQKISLLKNQDHSIKLKIRREQFFNDSFA